MCGIAGFSGSFDKSLLDKINQLQSHRGPDDHGIFFDSNSKLGLAHVRLSILDLSSLGHQPMHHASGKAVIVFNGEIYNFRELRQELQAEGTEFQSHSDTEVLITLYLRDGHAMLGKLNGIFTFAIWDTDKKELFLARDCFGVKPLYYTNNKNGFAFASEIKALLPLLTEQKILDPVALHRYLSFIWCPGETTPLSEVHKFLPGTAMIVQDGNISRSWQWYQLPVTHLPQKNLNKVSAIQGTEMALRTAVHRQLVSDVPVGAFLSGGLDSSAVVAMAREKVANIQCFTIESKGGSEDGFVDDLPYARQTAQHLGVPLEVISIDSAKMATDLEKMVYQLDEPLADPAALNVFYVSQLAQKNGIKVLLSGAGGDDLFTGYRRHRVVNTENYWTWLPKKMLAGLEQMSAGLDQQNSLFRRLAKLFSGSGLTGDARLANCFIWSREADLMKLYTPEFRAALGEKKATQPLLDFLSAIPENYPKLEKLLALEQRFFLTDHNLNYTDKMSMAAGVEVRVPFLDLDLVNFSNSIPTHFKQRGLVGKWVLKKAMEPYLPHHIIYRPKSGFGAPVRRWMRYELRELLGDILSTTSLKQRGLFDATAVQQLIKKNDSGEVDASYTLLSLLCIEIWCRRFIDQTN